MPRLAEGWVSLLVDIAHLGDTWHLTAHKLKLAKFAPQARFKPQWAAQIARIALREHIQAWLALPLALRVNRAISHRPREW
jgi:hypothetical protein